MPSSVVERATSDLLIGPDWSMNLEICDTLNREPGLAKDVVRGLKKRIEHKNPKVQLLALTLLETIIKNCGDIVHMHVAEKDVPQKMVKIVKKKPDYSVKEKILVLIDTWQEAFGGPQARYPQFYAAYHDLLRAGAVFPKKRERGAPLFAQQKHSLSSQPQSSQGPDHQQDAPKSTADSEFLTLSLEEMQHARGLMDVLSEMLDALDPGNKEGLEEEVIRDLVQQCRSYKMRLVHLVNTTSDEDLLSQGLALNDDLQQVLAKRDALAAGVAVRLEKTKSLQALVDIDDPVVANTDSSSQRDQSSNASDQHMLQKILPGLPPSSEPAASPGVGSHVDLLSGEGFGTSVDDNQLALVPVGDQVASSAADEKAIVLADMPYKTTNDSGNHTPTSPFDSFLATPTQQAYPSASHPTIYSSGTNPNLGAGQYEQLADRGATLNNANLTWNDQAVPGESDQGLPLPPWETQPVETSQFNDPQTPPMQSSDAGTPHSDWTQSSQQAGMYHSPLQRQPWMMPSQMQDSQLPGAFSPLPMPNGQQSGMHPQMMQNGHPQMMQNGQQSGMHPQMMQNGQQSGMHPQMMQNGQQSGMHPQMMQNGQLPGPYFQPMHGGHPMDYPGYIQRRQPQAYIYSHRPPYPYSNQNEISQGMYGLSMHDNVSYANAGPAYQTPTSSYVPQFKKPSKPEDKLFGDLLTMAKSKQNKTTASADTGNA